MKFSTQLSVRKPKPLDTNRRPHPRQNSVGLAPGSTSIAGRFMHELQTVKENNNKVNARAMAVLVGVEV